jgi:hypothetical protein
MHNREDRKRDEEDILGEDELDDDDVERIRSLFFEEMVPRLMKSHARLGTINCEFAGRQYRHWNIQFKSLGSEFDIVLFEYDEESGGLDLDL